MANIEDTNRWVGGAMRSMLALATALMTLCYALPVAAQQCVPYARSVTGVGLSGDAWRWWDGAEGRYARGTQPRPGAVLVFKKNGAMRYGHVAVVARVLNRREVVVNHSNWSPRRGRAGLDLAVDVSPANDWSAVRVWHEPSASLGSRVNPTYGFIYPESAPSVRRGMVATAALRSTPRR